MCVRVVWLISCMYACIYWEVDVREWIETRSIYVPASGVYGQNAGWSYACATRANGPRDMWHMLYSTIYGIYRWTLSRPIGKCAGERKELCEWIIFNIYIYICWTWKCCVCECECGGGEWWWPKSGWYRLVKCGELMRNYYDLKQLAVAIIMCESPFTQNILFLYSFC